MIKKEEVATFYPTSRQEWRNWLLEHHRSKQSVWLVCYKINSGKPSIFWSQAAEEALCFGWIDSIRKCIDDGKFIQFFGRGKPQGTWSKVNEEKVKREIAELATQNKKLKQF